MSAPSAEERTVQGHDDTEREAEGSRGDRTRERAQTARVEETEGGGVMAEGGLTGQELIDYIQALRLEDWEFEMKVHGAVVPVVDAVRIEGKVRLYPNESEE